MVSPEELERAEERLDRRRQYGAVAAAARYDATVDRLVIRLRNGAELSLPRRALQDLEPATPLDLSDIEVSPTGLGLHFPALDADLYVPALLDGVLGSRAWMATRTAHDPAPPRRHEAPTG